MTAKRPQVFLSHSGEDEFEAELFQIAIEKLLKDLDVRVWRYGRDQARDERSIAASLRDRIEESAAMIVLVSQFTLTTGAAQWTELGNADAFRIPIFILMHHVTLDELKQAGKKVPPLVLATLCTAAKDWKVLEHDLRRCCSKAR